MDLSLFRFQLRALLGDRTTLWQLLVAHWVLSGFVFAKKGLASAAGADAALWTNYGLFIAAAAGCMFGAIAVSFTLVKPRDYGMVELMLASPLSLRKLAVTSWLTCLVFSGVNLGLHFLIIGFRFGALPYGSGFYLSLAAAMAFTACVMLGAVILALRRKDAGQLHGVLLAVGLLILAPIMLTKLRLDIPAWLPPALAAAFLLCFCSLCSGFYRLINKEKAVLA
jgi:ABC-type multidrug transport system permease subunit